MKSASTSLTELRINTYEDPFLQHQYVCLGHKIASIRISLNMSQHELAHHIGISRSYLSKLECGTGISGMSLEILFKIAQAFQINVGQLVRLRIVDYKNCNAHLTSHYKRLEFLNHTRNTAHPKADSKMN
ncbi:helix-turn-helix transcriptional regulator [uncultured Veillonella sp.]|uniref:helix-turn-helix domain-containing protein n=1 Tax=uncultured Veillonella sp. TaxID=159268 RepID=UPI0028D8B714|nr:helix-turn-helix transcriptional regulator [uncultured Veillonella sp.]